MKQKDEHDPMDLAAVFEYLPSVLRGCWRFRWPAIAAAWTLCLIGWLVTLSMPNIYHASTRLYVDTQNTLRPLLQGLTVNPDLISDINLMMRAILSRPSLEKIARETDLDLEIRDQADLEGLIDGLRANIEVSKDLNNILHIGFTHRNPEMALAVVTALLNEFIEGSLGANRTDAKSAQEFLKDKLQEYELRLNESEERLAEFKKNNVGMMPGERGGYFARLQQEVDRLDFIQTQLRSARNKRDELERQLEGEEPVFGLAPSNMDVGVGSPVIDRQLAQYEQQLTDLRVRFTETHPDIVQIKDIIEDLNLRKAEQHASELGGGQTSYSPLDMNPVYQQMKIQRSLVDVELAEMTAQFADQEVLVRNLGQKVDTIPDIEAELKRLTRDYEVTQSQYEQLLIRLESAKLSEAAEESKDDIKFQVLDPPSVPIAAAGPNRALLATGVLIMGLLAGGALTFMLNFVRPVYFSSRQLERAFGISVIGVIGVTQAAGRRIHGRLSTVLLTICVMGLLGSYSLVLVFNKAGAKMAVNLMSAAGL